MKAIPNQAVTSSVRKEFNILLLGQTGVGRTTFINAFANYLINDTLEQAGNDKIQVIIPFKFTYTDDNTFEEIPIVCGKSDEYESIEDADCTNTQKCRSFVFQIGDVLLRLIDAPPVCDTRGVEQDLRNFDEIITYISQYQYLNGICVLLKPNEERLHILFRNCLEEILVNLPKCTMENLIFVFTNVRRTFYRPGGTRKLLRELFYQIKEQHGIQILFTPGNCFLLDNESFRLLAWSENGINLSRIDRLDYKKSWNHTVKEYSRLLAYIATRSAHTVHNTVELYEVRQLLWILATSIFKLQNEIEKLLDSTKIQKQKTKSSSQIDIRINNLRDENAKIESVFRKICKFLESIV